MPIFNWLAAILLPFLFYARHARRVFAPALDISLFNIRSLNVATPRRPARIGFFLVPLPLTDIPPAMRYNCSRLLAFTAIWVLFRTFSLRMMCLMCTLTVLSHMFSS